MERTKLIEEKAQKLRASLGFDEDTVKISYPELKERFLTNYQNIEISEDIVEDIASTSSAVTTTDDKFVLHVTKANTSNKKVSLLMAIYDLDSVLNTLNNTNESLVFACAFLMPELNLLRKIVKDAPSIKELSEIYDLSERFITSRFETLEII